MSTWSLSSDLASLPALSIRQPWAASILNGKDVENRDWPTKFRGRFLIHAAKTMTRADLEAWQIFVSAYIPREQTQWADTMSRKELLRGGILGVAEMVDCVTTHPSPWFTGTYGFVLKNVRPLPFVPCQGAPGFFRLRSPAPVSDAVFHLSTP
jgi:hypothetical protein